MRPQRGGKHVAMGTHNSVLKLGAKAYIEVIAIDPQASIARPSALVRPGHGRASVDAARDAAADSLGRAHDRHRRGAHAPCRPIRAWCWPCRAAAFSWRITVPADGSLPAGGVLPTLIQWADSAPSDRRAAGHRGCGWSRSPARTLSPEPSALRSPRWRSPKRSRSPMQRSRASAAMLRTPRGPVTL